LTLDYAIWGGCFAAEAVLIALLLWRGAMRSFPAFLAFVCWGFVGDLLMYAFRAAPPATFFLLYEIQMILDSAMIFAVLVELAWSVLRPVRNSLPRSSWVVIALLIGFAGLLLWPVAGLGAPAYLTAQGQSFFRLQQTFAILRVILFLGMAGFSRLFSIGWKNRELQVATGLGVYSIVSLTITVLHTHQNVGPRYHWLDQVQAGSYLCALLYWVLSFATKEAERRDFAPQMASFMLLVGSRSKVIRTLVTDLSVTRLRPKDGK